MNGLNSIVELYYNNTNCFDFTNSKKEGVHRIGKYPATMVAPMQYQLLQGIVMDNPHFETLLDNFMGSGTSLVEGRKLGLSVTGIDINPYAVLLSRVKTLFYNRNEVNIAIQQVIDRVQDNEFEYSIHSFFNVDKWFRLDIKEQLSKIREAIILEKNKSIRLFLWVCMSEVIYKYSNDRTSTFKLHSMKEENIEKMVADCYNFFEQIILKNIEYLNYQNDDEKVEIIQGDALDKLSEIPTETINIICTSPPYGENATTVTYGQFSILFLKWFLLEDLECSEDMIHTYSKIDNVSLGSGRENDEAIFSHVLNDYLAEISMDKRDKVQKFFSDYYLVLREMTRVICKDGYLMMTVGNRRVDNVEQPLNDITIELSEIFGLTLENQFERNISKKNMPWKISKIKGVGAVESMKKEYILIFKKY